jgi:hypothetical protein
MFDCDPVNANTGWRTHVASSLPRRVAGNGFAVRAARMMTGSQLNSVL